MKKRPTVTHPPYSVVKAVENEFRATPTLADICAKHGLTKIQLYTGLQQTEGLPK